MSVYNYAYQYTFLTLFDDVRLALYTNTPLIEMIY